MSITFNKFLIIFSILVLASCSESVDIQLDPEVMVFVSNGSEQKISLTAKNEEYVILNEWLREHRSDWYVTSGRYPGGVFIKSSNYGIQITKTHVVLYSTTQTEPKALYIQKISPGELNTFKTLGK